MFQKKSLGQNFLSNPKILDKIIGAAEIVPGETVLEVGPGEGTLTGKLLAAGAHVIAVEKDDRLIPVLQKKFEKEMVDKKLVLIHADILDIDQKSLLLPAGYKFVANIPYYITGTLLRKFLEGGPQPSHIVFMLQKEVVERIVAKNGKESLLSLGVKAYGVPKNIGTVARGNFNPVPDVDSAILSVTEISRKNFESEIHEKKLFELAKKAFGQKRKMLTGTLSIDPKILTSCGIAVKARPEELSVENWLCLAKN